MSDGRGTDGPEAFDSADEILDRIEASLNDQVAALQTIIVAVARLEAQLLPVRVSLARVGARLRLLERETR